MKLPGLNADDLIDHLATALMVFDAHGKLAWMNASAESLLNTSVRQMAESSADQLWPDTPQLGTALGAVMASGQSLIIRELSITPRPGLEAIRVDCVISALPAKPSVPGVMIEMRLSDHDRALVRDSDQETQHRLALRMVYNLAHELRNPLAGLRGAAQLLERKLGDPALQEFTRIIVGEADRLGTLVSGLLGPERLPRQRLINLHRPLEHVRRLVAASQSDRIRIDRDYDPSVPRVRVDPDQLVQALLNVLRNACEALAEQDGTIRLRTRVMHNVVIAGRSHRLCARISVIDNGPGISADQIERVFFPMVSGRPDHSGLGLSIARSLVSANHGRIDCASRPGLTEFMIDLPMTNHAVDPEEDNV